MNAAKTGSVTTYGNTVVYSCLTGYEASMGNTRVLQCQNNGTWNGTALACTGRAFQYICIYYNNKDMVCLVFVHCVQMY